MANGIASTRPPGLQVSPVAQIGTEVEVTPGVQDFMGAFRSGFITVDDITRRAQEAVVRPSEIELRGAEAEQGILDANTIRPQKRELESRQLEISLNNADLVGQIAAEKLRQDKLTQANTGASIPSLDLTQDLAVAKEKTARDEMARTGGDVTKQTAVFNADQQSALLADFSKNVGQIPTEITVTKPITPKPIEQWAMENPGRPASEYVAYQKEAAVGRPTVVRQGEPEYFQEIQEQLIKRKNELAKEATAQAIAGPLELQRAKTASEAPALEQKSLSELRGEMQKDDVLKPARLQIKAAQQIRDLASKPNPTNQDDLGLIYATVRALDPTSAVREGEVSMLQKGIAGYPRLKISFNRLVGNPNAVLDNEIRANLLELGNLQERSAKTSGLPALQKYYRSAIAQKLPLQQVFDDDDMRVLIEGGSAGGTVPGAIPTGAAPTAPGRLGTPGYPKQLNGGYIFEIQPDGRKINLGLAK